MKKFLSVGLLMSAFVMIPLTSSANTYDRDDSDYPLRYVAYVVHPIGWAVEKVILRPIHSLAHVPGVSDIIGHEPLERTDSFADYREDKFAQYQLDLMMAETQAEATENELQATKAMLEESQAELQQANARADQLWDENQQQPAAAPAPEAAPMIQPTPQTAMYIEELLADGATQLTVLNELLFSPGRAELTDQGTEALDQVINRIGQFPSGRPITIEGHTDSDPIQRSGWKSNWELGMARALSVLDYMVSQGVDPARLNATTYGMFKPRAEGQDEEAKALNRRVSIKIEAETGEVEAAPAAEVEPDAEMEVEPEPMTISSVDEATTGTE